MRISMKYRLSVAAVLLIMVIGIAGCSKDSTKNQPGPNEVWMQNTAFTPATITVAPNTTIKWTNMDNMQHTVTSDSGVFNSDTIQPNGAFSHTFTNVGQYPYHCNFHSNMTAKVVVQ